MLLLALSLACGPTTSALGDTGQADPNNSGDDTGGGDDTDDTDDTDEPETSAFEGDYSGQMGLFIPE